MLKILFNKDSTDTHLKYNMDLLGTFLSLRCENTDPAYLASGRDGVEVLDSYTSYVFVNNPNSIVKNFRVPTKSAYKFLNMNRLGVSIRMDYSDMAQLFSNGDTMCQIDTGIISSTEKDIIIRFFVGTKANFNIQTDMDVEYGEFSSADLPSQSHPRATLWDSYSLKIDDIEYKADRYGNGVQGTFQTPISYKNVPIELTIQKYKGNFSATKLTRDIDCEDVLIDCSCGVLDTKRVSLNKGTAKVHLYPFDYSGKVKIKLGRKWYEVWNEYNLILEKKP